MASTGMSREGAAPVVRLLRMAAAVGAATFLALWIQAVSAYEPWWVQNHAETELWSGPDAKAVSFGSVRQSSYFKVVAPQQGPRLHVFDPRTGNYAYIDASAVGPAGPPPQGAATDDFALMPARLPQVAPKLPPGHEPWWVANFVETRLWAGPEEGARSLGLVPQFRVFMVVEPQDGSRLHVWSPEKNDFGYLDASAVGPSGPSVWMRARPPRVVAQVDLPGRSLGDRTYIRNLPSLDDETELRSVPHNTPLDIREAVMAADGTEWYILGDGEYILAGKVRLPSRVETTLPGRWIDADLQEPAMVTAYDGDRVAYSALAIKGTASFSTPRGTFRILRRVENETMDSLTLATPIPRNAPGGYYLRNVLYTQYFTWSGASLHYNWWLGTFGYPGSHGCLGLNLADARWFWEWAALDTPLVVR